MGKVIYIGEWLGRKRADEWDELLRMGHSLASEYNITQDDINEAIKEARRLEREARGER